VEFKLNLSLMPCDGDGWYSSRAYDTYQDSFTPDALPYGVACGAVRHHAAPHGNASGVKEPWLHFVYPRLD